jgi:ribosomal protein S18 acetylase RimI-like enzyme
MMRVLPEYQGKGLGSMLLRWGLKLAVERGKRIFVYASPEGRALYEKFGFEVVGEVEMDMEKYGGKGMYIESIMLWNNKNAAV